MTLEEYRQSIDRRYAGESVALNAQEAARIRRREVLTADTGPCWLLVDPDGTIDGCHSYREGRWDSVESVWKRFEPKKKTRDALIAEGWTVRRDDAANTGRRQFTADVPDVEST